MDVRVQVPPSAPSFFMAAYARVVELADSLDSGSSVLHGRAGSSPASRTKQKALENSTFSRAFLCPKEPVFPYVFPLQSFLRLFCRLNPLDKAIHAAGAFLPHFLRDMGISVQRECRCMMPQVLLHGFAMLAIFRLRSRGAAENGRKVRTEVKNHRKLT